MSIPSRCGDDSTSFRVQYKRGPVAVVNSLKEGECKIREVGLLRDAAEHLSSIHSRFGTQPQVP